MVISKFLDNSYMGGYAMYGDKQTFSTQMKNVLIDYLQYTVLQKNLCHTNCFIHNWSIKTQSKTICC